MSVDYTGLVVSGILLAIFLTPVAIFFGGLAVAIFADTAAWRVAGWVCVVVSVALALSLAYMWVRGWGE